jgi:hypothetical protein
MVAARARFPAKALEWWRFGGLVGYQIAGGVRNREGNTAALEVSGQAGEVEVACFKAKRIFFDESTAFGKWHPAGREASPAGAEASDDFSKATSPKGDASTAGNKVSTPLAKASTTSLECPKSKTEWSTTAGQWTTVLG